MTEEKSNILGFPAAADDVRADGWHLAQAEKMRPRGFSRPERAVWDRVAPELSKAGRLKALYVDIVAEYCRVVARMAGSRKALDVDGWVRETGGRNGVQLKMRPEVSQLNDDFRKFAAMVKELGLSPASERNLDVTQGDLFGNEFDQLERGA